MSYRRISVLLSAALLLTAAAAQAAKTAAPGTVDISYTKFTLSNGLTVIVHEDHKAPVAAVNVWYHVGSKNEPFGRSGFAHLYEHLMFTGTQHAPDGFNQLLAGIGATDNNGTTNEDRTEYFENVPSNALDTALWMESERMGFLLPVLDQKKLDVQRGVVQNEKRQDENAPYGKVELHLAEATYPAAHPYHHTVIGSMEDLDAASLADVQEWFKTYYGPNNAVLSIAGDVDTAEVKKKVEQYFGAIPPTPPVAHVKEWTAKRSGIQREVLQDRVPAARVYMVWNVPESSSDSADYLELLTRVLSDGKASRLYKRLVYDDRVASGVQAFLDDREVGSQFVIVATALPGKPLDKVESGIREELARLLKSGPTAEEVARARTGEYADFVRGVERIGGFGGVSDVLAKGEVFEGDPGAYKESLARIRGATAADLKREANAWLSDGAYILDVVPFGDFAPAAQDIKRDQAPAPGSFPEVRFPAQETATLSNGLKLVLVQRSAVPLVQLSLLLDAGYASDATSAPGTARLAMAALSAGTPSRNALQISSQLGDLGADLSAGSGLDTSSVSLSALKDKLDPSLALFADVVLHPTFPAADVAKLRDQQLAAIQQERRTPVSMALRVFPKLLYGEGNAYSLPLTGSGYEASVGKLTPADLKRFHDTWFKPNNATLVAVGDVTMVELKPRLERLFAGWKPGSVPAKNLATVPLAPAAAVYLVDRPGSEQSIIFAGNVAPPYGTPDNVAIQTMNTVLGGDFTARVNMNLREDKHWAYGAYTFVVSARGQRPFIAYAPVQTDKTGASMAELQKELSGIVSDKPVTAEELARAKSLRTLTLPGDWETGGAVASAIGTQIAYGLPAGYWDSYSRKVAALTLDDMKRAADETVHPKQLIWVVVGDRAKIEAEVKALNLGPIHYLDADGNPLLTP
jgi:zinc protease